MRKFLIVGCGGSGGSTLAYIMDQITSELAAHQIDKIPAGWQFVHIDVPLAPDTRIPGVGNVFDQGGDYIATGPQSGSYTILDNAVSQTLNSSKSMENIGTWAPREPSKITKPIHSGAGQMRSVGRMITLSKSSEIRSGLESAFQKLNRVETNAEMSAIDIPGIGGFKSAEPPIVLVVSSMAGGAGASMALDVCRLLTLIPGVMPGMVGVFMVAADVFDGLPSDARGGVRANALAMLGEIVAAQTLAAQEHDVSTLAALGHQNGVGNEKPFARVFPVGRFSGVNRTLFGDGSQGSIYRGLGRGIAALMLSSKASGEFVAFDLGNVSGDKPARREQFGWGVENDELPWGSFGFASLSMGRDRYREYAAQRLARTSLDRLRNGHMQQGNFASSVEQVNALVASQWSNICQGLGFPVPAGGVLTQNEIFQWFTEGAYSRADVTHLAATIAEEQLTPFIPAANGIQALQWLSVLRQRLSERRAALTAASTEAAYRWAYQYKDGLLERFKEQVERAIAQFGLPYARTVVERIERLITEQLLPVLKDFAVRGTPAVGGIPPIFEGEVATMKVIANGPAVTDRLMGTLRGQTTELIYAQAADSAATVISAFIGDVLRPMTDGLSEAIKVLDIAVGSEAMTVGLANVATDRYKAWPSDADLSVPERFGVADNEILITESAEFGDQYKIDVAETVGSGTGEREFNDARERLVGQIVQGLWPVAGGQQAPGGLLVQTASWQPAEFNRDPLTNSPVSRSRAMFDIKIAPKELLGRARLFTLRPDESFDRFCSLSLRNYVRGTDASPSDIPRRHASIVSKFNQTLNRALPLISVNSDVVQQLHGTAVAYRFKFSAVPFGELDNLVTDLTGVMSQDPNVAEESVDILRRALSSDSDVKRVDIFGSYRNYSPLAFDSVLSPVAQQWAATTIPERKGFWSQRRSRTLPASLPMGDGERRAMVGGWFVGQITGQLRLPQAPYDSAVEVWEATENRWLQFPHPLLTPPSRFLAKSYDWLPAVLESFLIAVANTHRTPVLTSLEPYTALRRLYDGSSEEPASGLFEVSAIEVIEQWLRDGTGPSGQPSAVPDAEDAGTIDDRYEAAAKWLTSIRNLAGEHFIKPGAVGAPGGGTFSQITTRRQASATPIFRDLAEDIFEMIGTLLEHLDEARSRAHNERAVVQVNAGMPTASANDEFQLPEIGVF